MSTDARYMRSRDIARDLGITERTVRRWIACGELPSVRIGGARLVAKADLERLLNPSEQPREEPEVSQP